MSERCGRVKGGDSRLPLFLLLQTQSRAEKWNLPSCLVKFTHQVRTELRFQGNGSSISEVPLVVVSPAPLRSVNPKAAV